MDKPFGAYAPFWFIFGGMYTTTANEIGLWALVTIPAMFAILWGFHKMLVGSMDAERHNDTR